MKMKSRSLRLTGPARAQRGIVLIDAMVAILIFSVGILGMVALQASAVEMTGAANYRLTAATLADHVIAQMWASPPADLASFRGGKGKGDGDAYTGWRNKIDCSKNEHAGNCLPGVKAHPPSIQIVQQNLPNAGNTQYQVTVTVYWQAPSDSSVHKYVSVTAIGS
jgi:type IV pilus assembly protein PilV